MANKRREIMLIIWLKLTKGHNSSKTQSSIIMGTINGRFNYNQLKTAREFAERRLTVEKLPKDHKSCKMETITRKFNIP